MKTYIVKEEDGLKIIQVLFCGDSIQDVLVQFGQSPVIIEPPQ